VDFTDSLTDDEVESLAADSTLEILQTSSPVAPATWPLLNDNLFAQRHDVELRLYGFYSNACNLSFLPRLPNLRRFAADCLMRARGIEHIASLKNLTSLSVGIYSLDNFDFLEDVSNRSVLELRLGPTKSKKPRLSHLARFTQLRRLCIVGHHNDIHVISELPLLESLELCSISLDGLDFVTGLAHLRSLIIMLGGTKNLAALNDMKGLKYLELCQVRGLDDISVISRLTGLESLSLRLLIGVQSIPDLSRLRALRNVYLETMKGLSDIRGLETAPALEQLHHVAAVGMQPDQYVQLLKKKTLKRLGVGFGSAKKNKLLEDMEAQAGVKTCDFTPFRYV
jgi:hypothetical protein